MKSFCESDSFGKGKVEGEQSPCLFKQKMEIVLSCSFGRVPIFLELFFVIPLKKNLKMIKY